MRVGYLGPEGTFTHEALLASPLAPDAQPVALPSVHDTVLAVQTGTVDRAIVPVENSLEGAVNAALDALALDAPEVEIVGESVRPIRHCLIARDSLDYGDVEVVVSHPHASAQCARFLRSRLPDARVTSASSTAEAVRLVAAQKDARWAALGPRVAADLYGCRVLEEDVADIADNETRFLWLAPKGTAPGDAASWKTSIVFWGVGAARPGWLVRCLSEFADRGVNLSKIESRPRKERLGSYLFWVDLEGRASDDPVAGAIAGLRSHCDDVRALGSYPAAEPSSPP